MPNFSGKWTLTEQAQGIADGAWTGLPQYELYSWGLNSSGQLGLNDTANSSSPTQIGALTTWFQVSAGYAHSLAIKTDGTMWSWGPGGPSGSGRLGLNDTANRSSPVQIGALTTWSQISAGNLHSLAIKTDGTMWSWGRNNVGQLGLNDIVYRSSPVQIGALTTWSQVAAASNFNLAIKTDGTMWSWGDDGSGRLGLNQPDTNKSSPTQVGSLTTWAQVTGGSAHSLAIKTDGTLWSWGASNNGRLGLNNLINRSSPVQVGALTTWAQVSAGDDHSLAIKTDGTMWSWGDDGQGRLGLNQPDTDKSSPTQIGALTTWSKIAGGNSQSLALKTDGTMWSWGNDASGRLGLNDLTPRSSPTQIGALTTWSKIATGGSFSVAINETTT